MRAVSGSCLGLLEMATTNTIADVKASAFDQAAREILYNNSYCKGFPGLRVSKWRMKDEGSLVFF